MRSLILIVQKTYEEIIKETRRHGWRRVDSELVAGGTQVGLGSVSWSVGAWLDVCNLGGELESGVLLTEIESPGEEARYRYSGLHCGREDGTSSFSWAEFKMTMDYSDGARC